MADQFKSGREYQLSFNGGVLVRRLIQYSEHPLGKETPFKSSVEFQKQALRARVLGVVDIQKWSKDVNLNPHYQISGFESDLYQFTREQQPKLTGLELSEILAKVVEILINVGTKCGRTHGRLRPQSILFKRPFNGPGSISLTDFMPSPAAGRLPAQVGGPWVFEPEDVKAFGQLIIRLVTAKLDVKGVDIKWNDLPDATDPKARQCFGVLWPEWRDLAEDLLTSGETASVKTLDELRARLPGPNRSPPPKPKSKTKQTITFEPLPVDASVGDAVILSATASSELRVRFSVEGPARVAGVNLWLDGSGTVTVRASQAGDNDYEPAAEVTQSVEVRETQTIHCEPPGAIVFGAGPIQLHATASSGLPVEISHLSGPADVNGTTVTLTGAGIVEVKAIQHGDALFHPVEKVLTLTVAKAKQTISFPPLGDKFHDDRPFAIQAQTNSPLPVKFEVLDGPARIAGNTLSLRGKGKVTLRASQHGNENYEAAADVTQSFEVRERISQAPQIIAFEPPGDKVLGCAPFELRATASSDLPVEFRVVTGRATIQGRKLTVADVGPVTIQAFQPGNERFQKAETTQSFEVTRIPQTITFQSPGNKVVGDAPFALEAHASSGLPIRFSVLSGPASIRDALVSLTGAGQVTIKAAQSGDDRYEAIEATVTFKVSRMEQRITFVPVGEKKFGDAPFEIKADAPSGLKVDFTFVSGPANLRGSQVTLTGAGRVKIKATQPGDAKCQAAEATLTIDVAKAPQTIEFDPPEDKVFRTAPFKLNARSSTGLPVNFEVISGPAKLSGAMVTLLAAGVVRIKASQSGNEDFLPAEQVQSFTVAKASQAIIFAPLPKENRYGDAPPLRAEADSGLPVLFNLVSGPGAIANNRLNLRGVGVVTIKASQGGDANYRPAPDVLQTLTVVRARQTIAFDEWPEEIFVGDSFQAMATASSKLPVVLEVAGDGVAEMREGRLTGTGAGPVEIKATQAGDHRYEPAEAVHSFLVVRRPQLIHLDELENRHVGAPPFPVHASADSGLDVLLEVSGPATIDRNEVTVTDAGIVQITATQSGDRAYAAAEAVTRIFQVTKRPQRIHFDELKHRNVGDVPFRLGAWADSELAVEFDLLSGPATIDGDEVTVTGRGEVTIVARQPGNDIYEPADEIIQSFTVKRRIDMRRLIYPTLATVFLIGIIVATIEKIRRYEASRRAQDEIRDLIRQDKPLEALNVLKRGNIPQTLSNAIAQALNAVPTLSEPPPGLEVRPGRTATSSSKLTLPPNLPERELLMKYVRWKVSINDPTIDQVTLRTVTTNVPANETAGITASAGNNAPPGNREFVLTLSNQVVVGTVRLMVVVTQMPVAPPSNHAPTIELLTSVPELEAGQPARSVDLMLADDQTPVPKLRVVASSSRPTVVKVGTTKVGDGWQVELTALTEGTATVTLTAEDEQRAGATNQFVVKVGKANAPPTIELLTSVPELEAGQPATTVGLKLTDDQTAVPKLKVAASASRPTVVKVGTTKVGDGWQVELTALTEGTATVTLTAEDEQRAGATNQFVVKVGRANAPPTIELLTSVPELEAGQPAKVVGLKLTDDRTPVPKLRVVASSSRPTVLKVGTTKVGDRWQVELTPLTEGMATVTLTAEDEQRASATASNLFTVKPTPTQKKDDLAGAAYRKPHPGQRWTNSLGMIFVPVPVTNVLFCIWETRRKDYETYAKTALDVNAEWSKAAFEGVPVAPGPTHPVVSVSWEDAKRFCDWLTRKEQADERLFPDQHYRLPTDLEWSVAVGLPPEVGSSPKDRQSKVRGAYPWGADWPPPKGSGNYGDETAKIQFPGWSVIRGYRDGYATTAPVGSFATNKWGIYDLGGNVWEWCEDLYESEKKDHVLRGGAWETHLYAKHLLSSYRVSADPKDRINLYGFRLVLVVVGGVR